MNGDKRCVIMFQVLINYIKNLFGGFGGVVSFFGIL